MADTWLYVPEEPGAGSVEDDMCTLQINIQHEVIPSIICSTCFTAGLIYTLFGYCCFKMVTFFCGFLSGCAAVLLLHHREPLLEADLCSGTKAGLGLGVGVLCGLMSMLLPRLGLVLCGLQLGGLLSVGLLLPAAQCGGPAPAWLPLGVTAAAGSVAALLALRWQKLLSVIYTCVFGATTVTLCVDYLLGRLALPDQVYDLFCEVSPRPLCWFNWTIAGMWPVLALVGGAVQWGVTARGVSHTEISYKKQKKAVKKLRHRESKRRPPPHRRRRPPPLKRYAGDVLAPSYLQSLQERQKGTGSSCSSVSTVTHTLIDFDFETGSMVPLTSAATPCYRF